MKLIKKHFLVTESTLDLAQQFANELSPGQLCVYTTDNQTRSRGSHSRQWLSPPGVNIYATYSFLLEKKLALPVLIFFPLVAGYSVIRLLYHYHFPVKLKWPNDILVSGKKISGILCESSELTKYEIIYKLINIGIGLNVNMGAQYSEQIDQAATSMCLEAEKLFIKEEVQEKLNEIMMEDIQLLISHGFEYFQEKISIFIENFNNQNIIFDSQENPSNKRLLQGTVQGIANDGRLILKSVYLNPQSPEEAECRDRFFITGRILRKR